MSTLKELRDERIKKLSKIRGLGINPYPSTSNKNVSNNEIIANYPTYEEKEVLVAGRIMSIREHGEIIFSHIQDFSGQIQLYIKKENLEKTNKENQSIGFDDFKLLDIGDIVEVIGTATKTKTGEISVLAKSLKILTKSIRPLPEKHEGLKDNELIFRKRYLDLISNPQRKELFIRKSKFWQVSREFLIDKGFLEVETPILEHVTGGADAKPFITHHDALDEDFYLRISTELYLKRLIGGGFEKVYTLGPNFRNEGLSDEHLQEYYQLEWYWAYADYEKNMQLVKELFLHIAKNVYGKTRFEKNNMNFDLSGNWERINYAQAIKEKFDVDVFTTPDDKILKILNENKVKLPGLVNRARLIDNLWKLIRKDIKGPAFLVNQPKFISPLAKSIFGNENYTERFQVIIAGSELGNGYSELNDPLDQMERFKDQQAARDQGDEEAQMMDIDFVEMLEYGMPPTSGYGQSERIFWFLENITSKEGTLFPQMRRKIDETALQIYGLKSPVKKVVDKKQDKQKITISIKDAQMLLDEHVKDEYQKLHAYMVATAMKSYAQKFKEDEDLWYITGLIHDLDYFNYPTEHPNREIEWLTNWGYPKEMIHAILAHAHRTNSVDPETKLAASLIAVDELAGFLYAYSLMKPEGFYEMDSKSVKKKFKDKAFARKVDREDILYGIEKFQVDFDEHVNFLISVFKNMSELKR